MVQVLLLSHAFNYIVVEVINEYELLPEFNHIKVQARIVPSSSYL